MTIFKVHYGKMTLKIYTKGERVLRIEVIVHNTKAYRWGRSLPCFPDIVDRLQRILERFLNAVGCIDKPRMRRVAEAVLALSPSPAGFTASDLAREVRAVNGQPESEYRAAARRL